MQGSNMSSGHRRGRPTTSDSKRTNTRSSFHDVVLAAVWTLGDSKTGVSRQKVVKHLSGQLSSRAHIERKVILALRRLLSSGKIMKVGAEGSFFKVSHPAKTKPTSWKGRQTSRKENEPPLQHKQVSRHGRECEEEEDSSQCDDDPDNTESEDEGLCEYEQQRLRNIEENRAMLASLNILYAVK